MLLLLIITFIVPGALLLYPLFSFIQFKLYSKQHTKSKTFLEPVSIIISCFNEEKFIREKILSFLDEKEWINGSEIIVVSGGSTDKTNEILEEFKSHDSISIFLFEEQIGKIRSVNFSVEKAKHDLIVFSDCRQKMKTGSVKALIHNFFDPTVGTVVSQLDDSNNTTSGSFLRKIISKTMIYNSKTSSCLNVYGALYAQRKSLFSPFSKELLFDDLSVITSTLIQNKRLVVEENAVIYDVPFDDYYKSERIQRLARGLLIYLKEDWKTIKRLSLKDFCRFIVYKYFKLLLPFSVLIWIFLGVYFYFSNQYQTIILLLFSFTLALLFIEKSRKLLILFLRIYTHFFFALIRFYLFKQQSNKWEKLSTKKPL